MILSFPSSSISLSKPGGCISSSAGRSSSSAPPLSCFLEPIMCLLSALTVAGSMLDLSASGERERPLTVLWGELVVTAAIVWDSSLDV